MDAVIEDWQEGHMDADHTRIRVMVDAHFPKIWALLRRLGVPAGSVDDAAQQVFLVALKKLDTIEPERERHYLQGIAVRVASDQRRTDKRRDAREERAGEVPLEPPATPDVLLEQARARAMLDEVLDAMPFELRVPFVLFELDELTVPEIARIIDVPEGTASSRLRRAREEFRRLAAAKKESLK